MNYKLVLYSVNFLLVLACVKDRKFDALETVCDQELIANSSFTEVKNLFEDETFQIQQDLSIEGYIISSDEKGNFFNVLHFQNDPINPTEGFQIEIDLRDSHLFYPEGHKIIIKLKGLYLGKSKDVFKLGGTFTSFGTITVGRLPTAILEQHIFLSCDKKTTLKPTEVTIGELNNGLTNTLVTISNIQLIEEEVENTFAELREETERTLTDCIGNEIVLVNSGFSDFQSEALPSGNGAITGVLLRDKSKFKIAIRSLNDIIFEQARCQQGIEAFSSNEVFISELADPDNNAKARFVELYNASDIDLPLNGWVLQRYTNANTTVGSTVDLSSYTIASKTTLVISPTAQEFEAVYGFPPDIEVGTNSPADSNGDDNLVLVDPFGEVIDVYGIIGEDGSGTNHEFQNGKALRNEAVVKGNPVYTFNEWTIYNDAGNASTIKQVQIAPEDFTPGKR